MPTSGACCKRSRISATSFPFRLCRRPWLLSIRPRILLPLARGELPARSAPSWSWPLGRMRRRRLCAAAVGANSASAPRSYRRRAAANNTLSMSVLPLFQRAARRPAWRGPQPGSRIARRGCVHLRRRDSGEAVAIARAAPRSNCCLEINWRKEHGHGARQGRNGGEGRQKQSQEDENEEVGQKRQSRSSFITGRRRTASKFRSCWRSALPYNMIPVNISRGEQFNPTS